ncbi:Oxoglutarate dehydrogenase (Succinyl-transferring) [Forsythia ovata]|uniref:Oxoglutarate dehydrogenase (Succinyl-transferring) n=1 Tax=Forsythia ovata TaxID=205694 RepID=A0ABD1RKG8_9LAMI
MGLIVPLHGRQIWALYVFLNQDRHSTMHVRGGQLHFHMQRSLRCQEEPMNMGAYNYIAPRLCTCDESTRKGIIMDDIKYAGPCTICCHGYQFPHKFISKSRLS